MSNAVLVGEAMISRSIAVAALASRRLVSRGLSTQPEAVQAKSRAGRSPRRPIPVNPWITKVALELGMEGFGS
jgi:hypothetical protein